MTNTSPKMKKFDPKISKRVRNPHNGSLNKKFDHFEGTKSRLIQEK